MAATAVRSELPWIVYFHTGTDSCHVLSHTGAAQTAAGLCSSGGKLSSCTHPCRRFPRRKIQNPNTMVKKKEE